MLCYVCLFVCLSVCLSVCFMLYKASCFHSRYCSDYRLVGFDTMQSHILTSVLWGNVPTLFCERIGSKVTLK